MLSYLPNGFMRQVYETIFMLHTGEGLWWLGLALGLAALAVPPMTATGIVIWCKRRRAMPSIKAIVRAAVADTVILIGSESNSTWGFAKALHDGLTKAGHRVHTAPMNRLASSYRSAKRMLVLTATYGDGDAPCPYRKPHPARID